MRRMPILVAVLGTVLSGSCAKPDERADAEPTVGERVAVAGGTYTNLSVPEFQRMMAGKDFALVNVHIPFEGDLPRTDVSIPYNEITSQLDQLPADKDAGIVLYCKTGRMSAEAAEALVKLGYGNVYNLLGGFAAWQAAGLPMVPD